MKKNKKNINVKSNLTINTLSKAKVLSDAQLVRLKGGIAASIISVG